MIDDISALPEITLFQLHEDRPEWVLMWGEATTWRYVNSDRDPDFQWLLDDETGGGEHRSDQADRTSQGGGATSPAFPPVAASKPLQDHYVHHLLDAARVGSDLTGVRVVVDCANGAATSVASSR